MNAVDPVWGLLASAFFSLLFGIAATHKLTGWRLFAQQLADYRVLPEAVLPAASVVLPVFEAALALAWLEPRTRLAAAIASALLLAVYGAAIALNLARGRDLIDCGCGGADGSQVIRPALVGRNAVLALAAAITALLFAMQPDGAQALRVLGWLDWASIAAGALALTGMLAVLNQILANLPPQRLLD